MGARDRFWLILTEVVYYRIIVDEKLAANRQKMMWCNIIFAIIGTGALGAFLVYHHNVALLFCLASQCYQASQPFLPWFKDAAALQRTAARYDRLGDQMESYWARIDGMSDDDIMAKAEQFEARCTKLISGLHREGIGFSKRMGGNASDKRNVYMKRFDKDTAFAAGDKPEA